MKKVLFIAICILLHYNVNAQRFGFGIITGMDIAHHYHFKTNVISPLDIPEFYFVNNPESPNQKENHWSWLAGKQHKTFAFRFGPLFRFSYKVFSLRLSSTFEYSWDKFSFWGLNYLSNIEAGEGTFALHALLAEYSSLITVDLQKKATAFYVAGGWSYMAPIAYSESRSIFDYRTQTLPYLYTLAYNEFSYQNFKAGLGKKFPNTDVQLIYTWRRDHKDVPLDIVTSRLELNFNFYLKGEPLKKGHYLYINE